MEPLTAGAIATLAFTKASEETIEKFTKVALLKMDVLRKEIWEKLRGNPNAEQALTAVEGGNKAELEKVVGYLQYAMLDSNDQLILLLNEIAEKLKNEPQADLKQLLADLKAVISENPRLKQAAKHLIQLNQDNATSFQTLVEGGTAQLGVHYHVDKDTLHSVLETFVNETTAITIPKEIERIFKFQAEVDHRDERRIERRFSLPQEYEITWHSQPLEHCNMGYITLLKLEVDPNARNSLLVEYSVRGKGVRRILGIEETLGRGRIDADFIVRGRNVS